MPYVFISYRREDTISVTGRISDYVRRAFGEEKVFLDVTDTPPGYDFRTVIKDAIAKSDVILVIIGSQWISIQDRTGQRRLDLPNDFVRLEIEEGLYNKKLIIPVLVNNAEMPSEASLPKSIAELAFRNAARVRFDPDFIPDIEYLIQAIKAEFPDPLTLSPAYQSANSLREFSMPEWLLRQFLEQMSSSPKSILQPPELKPILGNLFSWCEIPTGRIVLRDNSMDGSETPKRYSVERFYIAKYPVTRSQYQEFLKSEDGYGDARWWLFSEVAYKWYNRLYIINAGENNSRPVVHVTWFEAVAFCNWLSYKTGQQIVLPTEQQWQRAGQGDESQPYPWGHQFEPALCNLQNEKGTVPVTSYPLGASPFGVVDMVGNVWEWCLNTWETGEIDLHGEEERVIRGGSWRSTYSDIDLYSRHYSSPYESDSNLGFRIAWTPPFHNIQPNPFSPLHVNT